MARVRCLVILTGAIELTSEELMAYQHKNKKGQTYFLHGKEVTLQNGRKQQIYFFAREEKDGALNSVPAGYRIEENDRTGLPFLKKG